MSGPLELAPTPQNVARARRWSQDRAAELGLADLADEVGLLVTELVSNVVLHARTPCSVAMERRGEQLRVEVSDASTRRPTVRSERGEMAQSGRGLQLVERVASDYGTIERGEAGKTVWFELGHAGSTRR